MTMRFQSVHFTHVKVLDLVGVANGHQLVHLRLLLLQPPHVPLLAIVQPALQLPLLPGLLPPCVGSLLLPPRGGLLLDSGLGHGHAT
jgi:hypothetical protein